MLLRFPVQKHPDGIQRGESSPLLHVPPAASSGWCLSVPPPQAKERVIVAAAVSSAAGFSSQYGKDACNKGMEWQKQKEQLNQKGSYRHKAIQVMNDTSHSGN